MGVHLNPDHRTRPRGHLSKWIIGAVVLPVAVFCVVYGYALFDTGRRAEEPDFEPDLATPVYKPLLPKQVIEIAPEPEPEAPQPVYVPQPNRSRPAPARPSPEALAARAAYLAGRDSSPRSPAIIDPFEKNGTAAIDVNGGPTTIPPGTFIAATLTTPIDSSVAGSPVTAEVREPVRSPQTGQVLIPVGSQLLGHIGAVQHGMRRVTVSFTTLVLGHTHKSLSLEGFPAFDVDRQAGLGGAVNRHMVESLGNLAVTTLGAILSQLLVQPRSAFDRSNSAAELATRNATQQAIDRSTRIYERDIFRAPTITVPSDLPFYVLVEEPLTIPAN